MISNRQPKTETPPPDNRYFYLTIASLSCGLILFILAFFILKIYGVIGSTLCGLLSITFINKHLTREKTLGGKILKVASYILFVGCLIFIVIGIILSATQS